MRKLYVCRNRASGGSGDAVATEENSLANFGLVIAYVPPGFPAPQALRLLSPPAIAWGAGEDPNPQLSAFLSSTVMALAAGLTVSTVRWFVIDRLHHLTGLRPPRRDFSKLDGNVGAYEFLGLIHYRYYKFYANMVVALIWDYAVRGYAHGWHGALGVPIVVLFFFASRDSLGKYYQRTGELLGEPPNSIILPD